MCIRDRYEENLHVLRQLYLTMQQDLNVRRANVERLDQITACLLYTSDAADERSSVDLGGRRILKKKT